MRERLVEEFELRKLRSQRRDASVVAAVEWLGRKRSERAIPDLVRMANEESDSHWQKGSLSWAAALALT
jgi:hypothetical protein